MDGSLQLFLTSFARALAIECPHHLFKLQACITGLFAKFPHLWGCPAWVLFAEGECDWLPDMGLCLLIERRMLNYFSNHLLSTQDTENPAEITMSCRLNPPLERLHSAVRLVNIFPSVFPSASIPPTLQAERAGKNFEHPLITRHHGAPKKP